MFWVDEITISVKKITLMDYQIVFLIGPINHCLSIKILLYLIQCFKTILIKK